MQPANISLSNHKELYFKGRYVSKQLKEKRIIDGKYEQDDYVATAISYYVPDSSNSAGTSVTGMSLLNSNNLRVVPLSITYTSESGSSSISDGGMAVVTVLNYTLENLDAGDPLAFDYVWRVDNTQGYVVNPNNYSVSKITYGFNISATDYNTGHYLMTSQSTAVQYPDSLQTYTLYSNYHDFYSMTKVSPLSRHDF